MDEKEKKALLKLLEDGKVDMLRALNGVTEEVAACRPSRQRWSILECVEHVAIAEDYLFRQTVAARDADAPAANQKREQMLFALGLDRTRTVSAPEMTRPSGRFGSLNEALTHFVAARERTIDYVENLEGDPRAQITTHPLVGTVNCYENLLIMAVHPMRHARQIEECKMAVAQTAAPSAKN